MEYILCLIFLCTPFVQSQKQGLFALQDNQGQMVWTDDGQFDKQLRVYQPTLPTSEWRMAGQVIQLNYNNLETPVYRFREVPDQSEKIIEAPQGFNWIWDDRLSWADKDASVWRVVCPDGFIALSDVFYNQIRINNPARLFNEFACVKLSLTEKCRLGNKLWDDSGSGASYDVGVWSVLATADQLPGGFFANSKQDEAPTIQPYCMRKNAFIIL